MWGNSYVYDECWEEECDCNHEQEECDCFCDACCDWYYRAGVDYPEILSLDDPKALVPVPEIDNWVIRSRHVR